MKTKSRRALYAQRVDKVGRPQKVDKMGRMRGGATFVCPECQGRSRVLRTTRTDQGVVIRQRTCLKCKHRFDTQELVA